MELKPLTSTRFQHQRHAFELEAGDIHVKVVASNKREGKQKAAQEMIKRLLPDVGGRNSSASNAV